MIILTIRTDNPQAEIALFKGTNKLDEIVWQAHRTLVESIHIKIKELLTGNNFNWQDIGGVVCYLGPGSFTGLRIGLTVGNSLAYGLGVPIAGEQGDSWQKTAINRLLNSENDKIVLPSYGQDAFVTLPKK